MLLHAQSNILFGNNISFFLVNNSISTMIDLEITIIITHENFLNDTAIFLILAYRISIIHFYWLMYCLNNIPNCSFLFSSFLYTRQHLSAIFEGILLRQFNISVLFICYKNIIKEFLAYLSYTYEPYYCWYSPYVKTIS